MTQTAITTTDNTAVANYMPVMNIELVLERRKAIVEFTKQAMVNGTDYGAIPGAGDKRTLLKPGAEKLCTLFGLTPRFTILNKTEDWTGNAHNGEAMFAYQYSCQLYRGPMMVAEGVGSCNSFEKKYRYREGKRVCPNCGKDAIIKGKPEYGGGWVCFNKKGGCGSKFAEAAPEIVNQVVGQIPNPDVADVVNTIDKMAQKRALIAAVLIAVNASEFFTQDMEDFDYGGAIDAEFHTVDRKATPQTTAQKATQPEPPKQAAPDLLAELRPIYAELSTQIRAIGQEPCKPPKNPTPAQVQDCIDQMRKALTDFDNMGKADPVLAAAQQLGGVVVAA